MELGAFWSVVMPTGPSRGRRSTYDPCPERLATGYAAPDDHIHTLYDNIETTISRHPQVRNIQHPRWLQCNVLWTLKDLNACSLVRSTGLRPPQAPYVGERAVNSQGEPGPYQWLTYKQVSPHNSITHPLDFPRSWCDHLLLINWHRSNVRYSLRYVANNVAVKCILLNGSLARPARRWAPAFCTSVCSRT